MLHPPWSTQLFTKLDCDELEILEHTQQLLTELGPEQPITEEAESTAGGGVKEDDSEDSGSEDANSQNMDTS